MSYAELLIGVVVGLGGALLGSYSAHRYEEHREAESLRVRTNNVLFAIAAELYFKKQRLQESVGNIFTTLFPSGPIRCHFLEGKRSGIDSFRENIALVTSDVSNQNLVREIIELDQTWDSFEAALALNNHYLLMNQEALSGHAQALRVKFQQLSSKAEDLIRRLEEHLRNSQPKQFSLIPKDWEVDSL